MDRDISFPILSFMWNIYFVNVSVIILFPSLNNLPLHIHNKSAKILQNGFTKVEVSFVNPFCIQSQK